MALEFPEIEIQITRGGDPQPITDLLQGEIEEIQASQGVNLKQAGDPVTGNPHDTLNFTGAVITDNGSGQATIAVSVVTAGTQNHLAKYAAGGASVGNSTITDDGTTVTIPGSGGVNMTGNLVITGEILNTDGISSTNAVTGSALQTGGGAGPVWFAGSGSPQNVLAAAPGCIYSDVTNGNLYVKHTGSGNTGWALVTAV